jgi:hypothetical protein
MAEVPPNSLVEIRPARRARSGSWFRLPGRPVAGRGYRPRLEGLEERWLPSTVTNLNDSGTGSLRDALATTAAGGTVDFQPGLTGTITLTSGTLTVGRSLTVTGPGAKVITVSGNNAYGVFHVSPAVTVASAGLTVANARGVSGIINEGTLTLSNSTFSNNACVGGGGAIFNPGTLTVTGSTFTGNMALPLLDVGGAGGAITNGGTLTVVNSTLSGNAAVGSGAPGGVGGLGGGINNGGTLRVINSTLSGNTATGNGSAGGGLFSGTSGSVVLQNTLVAGNSASVAPDVSGPVTQSDHDLIAAGDGSTGLVNGQNGNQVGTAASPLDPKLGPLQDNGGPTPTLALLPASPGIDAGDNAASPGPTDQRGLPRIVGGTIDVGAYELQTTGIFALGGAPGRVRVRRDSTTALLADFAPYGAAYTGGVSVAVGDVNGDGYPDPITGATVGNPSVKVYDGKALATGTFDPNNPDASLLVSFFAYGLNFNVGANVAVGDIEHDGHADIVTGATVGNPDVHVYRGKDIANHTFDPNGASLVMSFFPYALGFNIGANVAAGDVTQDGYADIVTGPTAGNPDVRVYNGKDIAQARFDPTGASLLAEFFPYALNFNVGAFVAVGDTTGDGFGDVITGASVGNPDVHVYDGKAIANHTFDNNHPEASLLDQLFAYDLNFNIGVAVAAADFEGNGEFDLLTGASSGAPHFRIVRANATGVPVPALAEGMASDIEGGLLVGA